MTEQTNSLLLEDASDEAKRMATQQNFEDVLQKLRRPDLLQDVVDFHEKFKGQLPTDRPDHQLTASMQAFKLKHLREEVEEYAAACERDDMEDAFDSLIDLVYVALGVVVAHRFQGVFYEGWRRVQTANMAKKLAESASESKRGAKFDIVKPEGWTPPDHSDLVANS